MIGALALIGGLAAACFAKAFGVVFLGEPRSDRAAYAHEAGRAMRWPMYGLAGGCVAIGVLAPLIVPALAPLLADVTRVSADVVGETVADAAQVLRAVGAAGVILIAVAALLAVMRRALLSRRDVGEAVTWDCGYARPTARMQYTRVVVRAAAHRPLRGALRTRASRGRAARLLPAPGRVRERGRPTSARERLYAPLFDGDRPGR